VWKRTVNGRVLTFHLAGINNENFLMRDEETASWWQQITGKAIAGPMKGARLEAEASDELTFGLWKSEAPAGQVLLAIKKDEKHYESNWEAEVAKLPVVVSFKTGDIGDRDIMVGLENGGEARAYPLKSVLAQSPIMDRLGGTPVMLVAGPDGKSVRAFLSRVDSTDLEFFRSGDGPTWRLVDSASASSWNFQGCATDGAYGGKCLERITALKDYWFDWRNYHPATTVYRH
jgi:hypothetical protein